MKFLALFLFAVLLWLPMESSRGAEATAAQFAGLALSLEPAQLVNGSPVLFRVRADKPLTSLRGTWLGHRVVFEFDSSAGVWLGLAGVELGTSAGTHPLKLEYVTANGARSISLQNVPVSQASYASSTLTVNDQFLKPDLATQQRIKLEREIKRQVFRRMTPNRLWKGSFLAPVDAIVTEPFGVRRIFNGKLRSTHQGLDFRAATGTPVKAMNSGEVILARDMFYEGGLVVIDHGQGLLTLYLHLSEFKTKEGDRIRKGQIIGLSGATGRVTAEHLHTAVRWQGAYLDPATLLTMKLP